MLYYFGAGTLIILLSVQLLLLARRGLSRPGPLVTPLNYFAFWYFILYGVDGVYTVFFRHMTIQYRLGEAYSYGQGDFVLALAAANLALLALALGYTGIAGERAAGWLPSLPPSTAGSSTAARAGVVNRVAAVYVVLGLMSAVGLVLRMGGPAAYATLVSTADLVVGAKKFLYWGVLWGNVGAALLVESLVRQEGWKRGRWTAWGVIGLQLLTVPVLGSEGRVLLFLLWLIVIREQLQRPSRVYTVALLGAAFLFTALYTKGGWPVLYRLAGTAGRPGVVTGEARWAGEKPSLQFLLVRVSGRILFDVVNDFDSLDNAVVLLANFGAMGWQYGRTALAQAGDFLRLLGREVPKKILPSVSELFTMRFYPEAWRVHVAYAVPSFLEFYVNFGWIGLLAGMWLYGVIIRLAEEYYRRNRHASGMTTLYAILVTNLGGGARGELFGTGFTQILQVVIPAAMAIGLTMLAGRRPPAGVHPAPGERIM